MRYMKNLAKAAAVLAASLIGMSAFAAPQIVVKAVNSNTRLSLNAIPQSIQKVIADAEAKNPDLYKIIAYQHADHYIIYLLSNKYWRATKIRADLDKGGRLTGLMNPYMASSDSQSTQTDSPATCPDPSIQFVVISAYPGVGAVDQAIAIASKAANKKYKTMTILSESADAQTYKNWFSCPKLKGFYSIGHGTNSEMIVGNETIVDVSFFAENEFNNKYSSTTVILNSCELFNYPFGSQMLFGNAETATEYSNNPGPRAYEFMGGYTDLLMNDSELSSACFVEKALNGAKMDYLTLKQCIGARDIHFQGFGLAYPGKYLK